MANNPGLASALQQDGKTIVAGLFANGTDEDFALVRYRTDGGIDAAFGNGGSVITDFGSSNEAIEAIALQSDGKIIAAGFTSSGGGGDKFALVRYGIEGALDPEFGTGGKVIADFPGTTVDQAYDLAIQPDGKIVVVGYSGSGFPTANFGIARFNPNGSLDTTFGVGGLVSTDFGSSHDVPQAVALQGDGKIVVGGLTSFGSPQFGLVRYNTNGSLDGTFGAGGKVSTLFPGSNSQSIRDLVIQDDSKILAVGTTDYSYFGTQDFALVRYNSNGSLDGSFSGDGMMTADVGGNEEAARAVLVQPDGMILVVGVTNGGSSPSNVAVTRHASNGDLDPTFGSGGRVVTDVLGGADEATGVLRQQDGKILVIGSAHNGTDRDFALVRYDSTGALDSSFDLDGKVATDLPLPLPPAAEVTVLYADSEIESGNTTPIDFGYVAQNVTDLIRTFTVRNEGNASLTLGVPVLPVGFALAEGLDSTIAPGEEDTFSVRLVTITQGQWSGQITIPTNDSDESPFTFTVAGEVVRTPVLIVPGILGSLPEGTSLLTAIVDLPAFLRNVDIVNGKVALNAANPLSLVADPLLGTYTALITSFEQKGFHRFDGDNPFLAGDSVADGTESDLFFAAYDWRLPVLLNPDNPSELLWNGNGRLESGVEYLDWWIDTAKEKWEERYDSTDGFAVDIVAHSMGGLLARAYLQEAANAGQIPERVNHLIMLGTPNAGAVDTYQFWDPFLRVAGQPDTLLASIRYARQTEDSSPLLRWVLRGAVNEARQRGADTATAADLVPSLRDLMPTLAFFWDRRTREYIIPPEAQNYLLVRLNGTLEQVDRRNWLLIGTDNIRTPARVQVNPPRGSARSVLRFEVTVQRSCSCVGSLL